MQAAQPRRGAGPKAPKEQAGPKAREGSRKQRRLESGKSGDKAQWAARPKSREEKMVLKERRLERKAAKAGKEVEPKVGDKRQRK